jgi:hypothetical protein
MMIGKRFGLFALVGVTALRGASPTAPEKYQILSGENGAGSAFVVQDENVMLAVMSLHQFDGKTPGKVESAEGKAILLDRAKVFTQEDVQALPVRMFLGELPFLKYEAEFVLKAKDEVAILGPSGDFIKGVLMDEGFGGVPYKSAEGSRVFQIETSQPFVAQGGSGGPIILQSTGAVIGVLLGGDNPQKARRISFETLCLPKGGMVSKPGASSTASTSTAFDSVVRSRILPPGSEHYRLGMKIEDLAALRPKMSQGGAGLRGTEHAETISRTHFFGIAGVTVREGKVVMVVWAGGNKQSTTPSDIVNTLQWLISVHGLPQRAFLRDLTPAEPGMDQTAYLWVKPDMIVTCSLHTGHPGQVHASLQYCSTVFTAEDMLYSKGAVDLPLKADALVQKLTTWSQNALRRRPAP